jgi:hypothetical protein
MLAAKPHYNSDLAKWQEVPVPADSDQGNRVVWLHAANHCLYEWKVFNKSGEPSARLKTESGESNSIRPGFVPSAGNFRGASAFATIADGWLVGFNHGEFGAALYWFSLDGERSYQISDHQVVDFVALSDGIHAIEGLAHMGLSSGSVIRIGRPSASAHWQATTIVALPFTPYAVSVVPEDTMLITLSEGLVSLGSDRKIQNLLTKTPWRGLYPNSSALSPAQGRDQPSPSSHRVSGSCGSTRIARCSTRPLT